ncbi:LacI family DNA-binding transcriptional regulator [Niabella aquatica]
MKEITIYNIADRLGLSPATISRALKNDPRVKSKTIKKVLAAAHEMGYQRNPFAGSLRTKKTNIIGVIVPRLASSFMSSAISGIETITNKAGYNIIISESEELIAKEKANVQTMFNNRVDGLIVSLSYTTFDTEHFKLFFNKKIPVVFFDRTPDETNSCTVIIDNYAASYAATKHLIEQGCRRIAHITASKEFSVYRDRYQGYRQALKDYAIEYNNDYLIFNNLSYDSGTEAAQKILAMSKLPDGVLAVNDYGAVGCMIALKKAGIRIPNDIAFVGFNNDPVCQIAEPNLTTLQYSGFDIGEVAAQSMLHQINGPLTQKEMKIILKSDLIVRASSDRGKMQSVR